MDFLTFLGKYEQEDVAKVKSIVESNKAKEDAIIKEAFDGEYTSKKEALLKLENYFVNNELAPDTVDVSYVNENLDSLKDKITNLSEGDIRIIIHNHEAKKEKGVPSIEDESATPKAKRGRPAGKKQDFTKAPKNTGVVYGVGDTSSVVSDEKDVKPKGGEEELSEEEKKYLGQLEEMKLTDEELKSASDMAESGTIDEEDDSRVAQAAGIISKINALG